MLRFLIALLLFSTSLLADQVSDFSKKVNLYERGVVFENAQTPMSIEAILALPNSQWSAPASANFDQTFSTLASKGRPL